MPRLFIKNQLNDNHKIEFCLANEEYVLEPDEEMNIEIKDGDCLYFDAVRKIEESDA